MITEAQQTKSVFNRARQLFRTPRKEMPTDEQEFEVSLFLQLLIIITIIYLFIEDYFSKQLVIQVHIKQVNLYFLKEAVYSRKLKNR